MFYRNNKYSIREANKKVLSPFYNHKGYPKYTLRKDGRQHRLFGHRIVAMAFIPNPDNLPQVNHKDFNKKNNSAKNLEWVTQDENLRHAFINGRLSLTKKAG